MATFKDIAQKEYVNERHLFVIGDNLTNTAWQLENGSREDVS